MRSNTRGSGIVSSVGQAAESVANIPVATVTALKTIVAKTSSPLHRTSLLYEVIFIAVLLDTIVSLMETTDFRVFNVQTHFILWMCITGVTILSAMITAFHSMNRNLANQPVDAKYLQHLTKWFIFLAFWFTATAMIWMTVYTRGNETAVRAYERITNDDIKSQNVKFLDNTVLRSMLTCTFMGVIDLALFCLSWIDLERYATIIVANEKSASV